MHSGDEVFFFCASKIKCLKENGKSCKDPEGPVLNCFNSVAQ